MLSQLEYASYLGAVHESMKPKLKYSLFPPTLHTLKYPAYLNSFIHETIKIYFSFCPKYNYENNILSIDLFITKLG